MSTPNPDGFRSARELRANPDDNGHDLIAVAEWLPGDEPTDYDIPLTDDPEYRTRYWRCRNCGQERNRRAEFRERCAVEDPPTPLIDGGYSIEEPRTRRALTERMDVRFGERGPIYAVHSQSGNTYEVNVDAKTCTCPDFQKRHEDLGKRGCKHLRRVDLEIRAGQIPRSEGVFVR